ncbi:hypothetical protein C8A00DRAFT_18673 [Chaetomidium leptoderma]|uniref:CFEM domain-containing protein n=1 Tax=Chaetomidium leptoderma TaxID=669021 RepID=A0AAN6VDX8_9PEZI|nr:hypothetical protein C8A00DRAFT_18673 [Chaetomidium leptoderma]
MALFVTTLLLAVSASARGITEPPSAITPAPEAACTLTSLIPSCGITCLISAAAGAGCPNPFDLACQCKVASKIHSIAAPCVQSKCGPQLGSTLDSVAAAICTECAV